jgi:hypothetical protein
MIAQLVTIALALRCRLMVRGIITDLLVSFLALLLQPSFLVPQELTPTERTCARYPNVLRAQLDGHAPLPG